VGALCGIGGFFFVVVALSETSLGVFLLGDFLGAIELVARLH
jgi:hypothetical protein